MLPGRCCSSSSSSMPRENSWINCPWTLQTGRKNTETELNRPFGSSKSRETPLWTDFTHTSLNSDCRGQLRCYRKHANLLRLFRSVTRQQVAWYHIWICVRNLGIKLFFPTFAVLPGLLPLIIPAAPGPAHSKNDLRRGSGNKRTDFSFN